MGHWIATHTFGSADAGVIAWRILLFKASRGFEQISQPKQVKKRQQVNTALPEHSSPCTSCWPQCKQLAAHLAPKINCTHNPRKISAKRQGCSMTSAPDCLHRNHIEAASLGPRGMTRYVPVAPLLPPPAPPPADALPNDCWPCTINAAAAAALSAYRAGTG